MFSIGTPILKVADTFAAGLGILRRQAHRDSPCELVDDGSSDGAEGMGRGVSQPAASPALRYRLLLLAVLGVFFLGLLPVISDPSNFHGDERFYTDAALQMLQTGNWWTPYYPDGQPRLNKPILTYWTVAGSMRILGSGLFVARLLFLLAGTLVIGLTFYLARIVGQDERTAFLASLILASNIEMLTLAIRATPDVLSILFVLLSFIGFARIWFQADSTWLGPVLAFGGLGLAVQTKGLLGLCPLVAMALCWTTMRASRPELKNKWQGLAIALGLGLALFWYAVMLHHHGLAALRDFYADQVGAKVTRNPGFVLGNAAAYLFAGFRHFLPWTLPLLAGAVWFRRELADFVKAHRDECVFLLSLFAVLVVLFSFGNMRRTRYLAISYPMLAVWLAGAVSQRMEQAGGRGWLVRLIQLLSGLSLLIGIGGVVAGWGCEWRLMAGGMVLIIGGWAGWLAARSSHAILRWTWLSVMCVAVFAISGACLRPVLSPSSLSCVAASLRQMNPSPGQIHTWYVRESAASELRLLGGGKWDIHVLEESLEIPPFATAERVLTTEPHQLDLALAGYDLSPITEGATVVPGAWRRRITRLFAHPTPPYWLAVKAP